MITDEHCLCCHLTDPDPEQQALGCNCFRAQVATVQCALGAEQKENERLRSVLIVIRAKADQPPGHRIPVGEIWRLANDALSRTPEGQE